MCIQRTVGVVNARQLWVIMHWLRLDGHPYKLPITIRDWSEFQPCKNKVPRWWRNYFRFAFLRFETDVLPTPITSVDPRVQSFRISGDFTPFRVLGFRVTFRRFAVPLFQFLGSPMVSRYWESSIILELFKLYELWSACPALEFPRQRNKYHIAPSIL